MKVLSIDNDAAIRYAMKALISSQGWEPLLAEDMKEGLRLLQEESPELILIDYHMPGVNGVEGVKMIRERDAHIPIIVFTIDDSQKVADAFMDAGADDFATKPIKAPDLISRINLHIRLMHRAQEKIPSRSAAATSIPPLGVPKGISDTTLQLVSDSMKSLSAYLTVDELSSRIGLSPQSMHRYLQYLEAEKQVEVRVVHGKVGRPRHLYKWIP